MEAQKLRLIIADDDPWIRDGLKQMVKWEAFGFELAGEASNGSEALKLCREVKPDAALVDISMPVMNGLEFIKEIKQELPLLKTIIMTCHDDFHYAKEAINLGCQHYLLKNTSDIEKIEEIMADMYGIIMESRNQLEVQQLLNALHPQSQHEMRDEWFARLIQDGLSEPYSKLLAFAGRVQSEYFLPMNAYCGGLDKERQRAIKAGLTQSLAECKGEVFAYKGSFYLFIPVAYTHSFTYETYAAAQQATRIRQILLELAAQPFLLLVQHPVKGSSALRMLPDSFGKQLEQSFYTPANAIVHWFYARAYEHNEDLLREAVGKWKDAGRPPEELDDIAALSAPPDLLKGALLEAVADGMKPLSESLRTRKELLEQSATWFEAKEAFIDLMEAGMRSDVHPVRPEIAMALQYIERHYSNHGLSLKDLADHAELTANYFSSLFKRELGLTVVEYINQYRLEAAKELIASNHALKGYEVAEMVGFQDPQYFSKLFKKKEGVSFKKYQTTGFKSFMNRN